MDVVHGTDHADGAAVGHVPQDRATLADARQGQDHVPVGHGLDECGVPGRAVGVEAFDGRHGGFDACQHPGQVAEHHVVAGTLDRAALSVPQDHDQLRPRGRAGELQAAQHVVVDKVAGDSRAEDIADALVEDQLIGGPQVDAADDGREGVLAVARGPDLGHVVALQHFTTGN